MTVICTITVIAMHFASLADVEGIVLSRSNDKYVVDFSKDAQKQGFDGDYSRKIVDKINCVTEKGE